MVLALPRGTARQRSRRLEIRAAAYFQFGVGDFRNSLSGSYGRAREAAEPSGPTFGTCLFVWAKNWVLRAQQVPKQAQRALYRVGLSSVDHWGRGASYSRGCKVLVIEYFTPTLGRSNNYLEV